MGPLTSSRLTQRLAGLERDVRMRLLVTSSLFLVAALALDGWLHLVGPLPGERAIGDWWTHWTPSHAGLDVNSALTFLPSLGTPWVAAATVAVAAAVVWENDGLRWAVLIVCASAVVALAAALKQALGPTPLWTELKDGGRNFPSGHVAYTTAVAGALALVAWRHRQRALMVALLTTIPAMAISMVVTGAHLPSDTIAGLLIGVAWLLGVTAVLAPPDAFDRLPPD